MPAVAETGFAFAFNINTPEVTLWGITYRDTRTEAYSAYFAETDRIHRVAGLPPDTRTRAARIRELRRQGHGVIPVTATFQF